MRNPPRISLPIDTADPVNKDAHGSRQEALVAGAAPIERKQLTSDEAVSIAATPDPDRFYEPSYIPVLEALIAEIVKEEGPLPLPLLGRRISALHGWQRTGRRIAEQVKKSLGQVEVHREGDVDFVWTKGSYLERIPFRTGLQRALRDVSRSEIADLFDQHSDRLSASEDPALELARQFGLSRLTSDSRTYLESCIKWRAEITLK